MKSILTYCLLILASLSGVELFAQASADEYDDIEDIKQIKTIVQSDSLCCINGDTKEIVSYSLIYPNPFQTNTTVDYTVDDDVILTIILYNETGRVVEVLMNNQRIERGTHTLNMEFPVTATNGLFNLVFYGEAINDSSVEYTRIVDKMQKIR